MAAAPSDWRDGDVPTPVIMLIPRLQAPPRIEQIISGEKCSKPPKRDGRSRLAGFMGASAPGLEPTQGAEDQYYYYK